jgi:hypothetical protein
MTALVECVASTHRRNAVNALSPECVDRIGGVLGGDQLTAVRNRPRLARASSRKDPRPSTGVVMAIQADARAGAARGSTSAGSMDPRSLAPALRRDCAAGQGIPVADDVAPRAVTRDAPVTMLGPPPRLRISYPVREREKGSIRELDAVDAAANPDFRGRFSWRRGSSKCRGPASERVATARVSERTGRRPPPLERRAKRSGAGLGGFLPREVS